jgi:hypothetical protein
MSQQTLVDFPPARENNLNNKFTNEVVGPLNKVVVPPKDIEPWNGFIWPYGEFLVFRGEFFIFEHHH